MGLLGWFKKNQPQTQTAETVNTSGNGQNEIPKNLFIEEREPQEQPPTYSTNGGAKGIEAIYAFLQADYEPRGYNDALTNPDDNYKKYNIQLIKHDLQILIQQVNTSYEDLLKEIDFHIKTRSRAGLIDLVEELETKKQQVNKHTEKVNQIQKESENMSGMCQRIILSYEKGFNRGLAAITKSKF